MTTPVFQMIEGARAALVHRVFSEDADPIVIDLIRTPSMEDFGERAPVIAKDGTFAPR